MRARASARAALVLAALAVTVGLAAATFTPVFTSDALARPKHATHSDPSPPQRKPAAGHPAPAPPVTRYYQPVRCIDSGPAVTHTRGPYHKLVALSFDDGPAPITPAFVTMLEHEHVPATFFMIGEQITSGYRDVLLRELRDGDALGDHTYTHPDLETLSPGEVHSQLEQTIEAIHSLTGYTPCVFRPPYGDVDQQVIDIAQSLGLATVTWDVDPSDWANPGTSVIVQRVLAQVQPGSIIISHDGGGPREETLAAYPTIIRALKQRGYRFETVPQLLGFKTVYEPCAKTCNGWGVRGPLPRGSIVQAP